MLKLESLRCKKLPLKLLPVSQISMFPGLFGCRSLISSSVDVSMTDSQDDQLSEPLDEAAQLEARRKKREAIRAKYKSQATPMRLQALHLGAETDSSTPGPDTGTTSNTASGEC